MVFDEMRPSETRQVNVEPPGTSWSVAKARGVTAAAAPSAKMEIAASDFFGDKMWPPDVLRLRYGKPATAASGSRFSATAV
jgi:hypothetical protein